MTTESEQIKARWTRCRWRFVDALIASSDCAGGRPDPACTHWQCCAPLANVCEMVGIRRVVVDARTWPRLEYREDLEKHIVHPMHDVLWMLGNLYGTAEMRKHDPFKAFLLVPDEVDDVFNSDYLCDQRDRYFRDAMLVSDDYKADMLYALAELAFPDSWLEWVHAGELMDLVRMFESTGDDLDICRAIMAASDEESESDR